MNMNDESGIASTGEEESHASQAEITMQAASAGELLASLISQVAAAILANDGAAADALSFTEESIRAVHDTRTSVRRLRAYLRAFRPLLDLPWSTELSIELRWYQEVLSPVRDCDVIYAWLVRAKETQSGPEDITAIERMLERAMKQRLVVHEAYVDTRLTSRGEEFRRRLEQLAVSVPLSGKGSQSTRAFLPMVRKARREMQDALHLAQEDPVADHIHQARIKAKGLRYVCDALSPSLGRYFSRVSTDAKKIQDRLGRIRDAANVCRWLEETAAADPRVGFTAGKLWVLESSVANAGLQR
ncbi:MAG: CHAD domain-containing protein [Acidimicrobiales bacterium]